MLYAVARRMQNAYNRGHLRPGYECKHSPGYSYAFTSHMEFTGQSTLDLNCLFHASSSECSGPAIGVNPTLQVYSHPTLPLGGCCLRIAFPAESKNPYGEV